MFAENSAAEPARDDSRWELGVGVGALSIPDYRGSDQRRDYVAPIPYVRYSGKRLKVDREGGRYYFYDGKRVKLDLSATFNFPVDSERNTARQGMPGLGAILEAGPRLQWHLWESQDHRLRLRFGAPLRFAINLSKVSNEGLFFAPYVQVRYFTTLEMALSIGPMWASKKYHDYYYQVEQQYATAVRPAYDATAGYSGFRITLTASHRLNKRYWWGGFLRYDNLSGAAFVNSPLVKQTDAFMAGIVIAYVFKPVKQYYGGQE